MMHVYILLLDECVNIRSMIHMYVCMYVCMYVHMYVCTYVCMIIRIWTGPRIFKRKYLLRVESKRYNITWYAM